MNSTQKHAKLPRSRKCRTARRILSIFVMDVATSFTIRPGKLSDLDRIVDITIAAADNHALIAYIYPNRYEFPDANRYHWTVLLRSMFYDANSMVLVAETEDVTKHTTLAVSGSSAPSKSRVVAWAEWEWVSSTIGEPPPSPQTHITWTTSLWSECLDTCATKCEESSADLPTS